MVDASGVNQGTLGSATNLGISLHSTTGVKIVTVACSAATPSQGWRIYIVLGLRSPTGDSCNFKPDQLIDTSMQPCCCCPACCTTNNCCPGGIPKILYATITGPGCSPCTCTLVFDGGASWTCDFITNCGADGSRPCGIGPPVTVHVQMTCNSPPHGVCSTLVLQMHCNPPDTQVNNPTSCRCCPFLATFKILASKGGIGNCNNPCCSVSDYTVVVSQ
jgi:hypothetical protein